MVTWHKLTKIVVDKTTRCWINTFFLRVCVRLSCIGFSFFVFWKLRLSEWCNNLAAAMAGLKLLQLQHLKCDLDLILLFCWAESVLLCDKLKCSKLMSLSLVAFFCFFKKHFAFPFKHGFPPDMFWIHVFYQLLFFDNKHNPDCHM